MNHLGKLQLNPLRIACLQKHHHRKRDFATPVIFRRVTDGYLFKRQETEGESKADDRSSEDEQRGVHASGDRAVAFGRGAKNSPIVSGDGNVLQWGSKYNVHIGKGENTDIGDKR